MKYTKNDLALHGGPKAKTTAAFPMYPGGLEIGEEEKKQLMEVIDNKYLFRYYGTDNGKTKVIAFVKRFSYKLGSKHALAVT